MNKPVRLRFAPSPTGPLHIGGIRTALYNYLFARKHGGSFILRVEDTDRGRFVEGAEAYIINSLKWVGLIPDEGPGFGGDCGPYRQSERKEIYRQYASKLIDSNEAYYAFDSTEELNVMRDSNGGNQKYDYNTRLQMKNSISLGIDAALQLIKDGLPYVIRLKVPANEDVHIEDAIRGSVIFNTAELDDKVLIKSDGMPTYHMANVIDDYLMKISHVIRGEEWLPSTAHHVLLYRAFGWQQEMPVFAHLPLILKPNGNGKLSKRDGAQFGFPVFPISWIVADGVTFSGFREYGFEPAALLNFLALLGWNNGTEQEIFSMDELIQYFSLEKIVKSGARFDFEKGKWFNQQYLNRIPEIEIKQRIIHDFNNSEINISEAEVTQIYELYKERALFAKDFFESSRVFFETFHYDADWIEKKVKPGLIPVLNTIVSELSTSGNWNSSDIEIQLKNIIKITGTKPGDLFPALRVAVSGIPAGPDVFKMIELLGKNKFINSIQRFVNYLNEHLKI
jgi:glutamyl-tRNA synthetase